MSGTSHMVCKIFAVMAVVVVGTVVAQDFEIPHSTVDGGGAGPSDASTGGSYTLSGTVGQSDARNHPEPMTGVDYRITGGFWVIPECPAIPADYDADCDVDQADYQIFEVCASGSEIPFAGDCSDRDFDLDGDVDQSDFGAFQRCFSGKDLPADPACAD